MQSTTYASGKRAQSFASAKPAEADSSIVRTMPHDVAAEQALIGSCILDGGKETLTRCIEAKIIPESFFKPANQLLFSGLIRLYEEGTPADEITLANKLKNLGQLEDAGGHAYINQVTGIIETTGHAQYYLDIVREKYLLRRLIKTASQTVEKCYLQQDSLDQFLEQVEQEVFRISEDRISDSAKPVKDSIDQVVGMIYQMIQQKKPAFGVLTGFKDLDNLTFGLHPQEMIVLAARPSVGKTSFAMNVAESAVIPNTQEVKAAPTLVFSLEMSSDSLAMRLLCSHARVNMKRIRDGFLNDEEKTELARSAKKLKEAPLWIDDSGSLTVLEIRAKARRFKAKMGLGLIVIDYLQLISGTDSRVQREQQIAEISRSIKGMAKELDVPVLVLSQLNRDSERERREPRLSDLRESGSIEQDADVVLLLHRPSKREDEGDEDVEEQRSLHSEKIELILAKQRNGPTGKVDLSFNKHYTRFENFAY